jgi:putative spermidine/putrescine transport system ATP-binding protein
MAGHARSAAGVIKEVEYLGPSTRFLVELDAGVTLMVLRQNTAESSLDVEALRNSRTNLSWEISSEYQLK